MQTIINWTRYDGTEATLPMTKDAHQAFDFENMEEPSYMWCREEVVVKHSARFAYEAFSGAPEWRLSEYHHFPCNIGDLWAPWPAAPQE